jgi:surfeit locus 1 family protein
MREAASVPQPVAGTGLSRLVPTLAAVAAVVLTAYLGNWQLDRAAGKLALQAQADLAERQPPVRVSAEAVGPETLAFRRVEAEGEFRPELTIYLDNRVQQGVVGYEVLTPLQVGPAMYVMVNRGWVRVGATREALPAVRTPAGRVHVDGLAIVPSRRYLELSAQTVSGRVWQNLDLEDYARRHRLQLQPVLIQQGNDLEDGLVRAWRRPDTGVDKHRAYALQWFTMSAVIVVIYLVAHVRRRAKASQRAA